MLQSTFHVPCACYGWQDNGPQKVPGPHSVVANRARTAAQSALFRPFSRLTTLLLAVWQPEKPVGLERLPPAVAEAPRVAVNYLESVALPVCGEKERRPG